MSLHDRTIAVVGATGAVGLEALAILSSRSHPVTKVRAIASERSAGSSVPYGGKSLPVQALSAAAFEGASIAIFALSADLAREWVPIARGAGCHVVDNSSAFRLDPEIPLVVPEINGDSLGCLGENPAVIANPNCSTILLLVALDPIRRAFGIERIVVATYQAVSGAGLAAMAELREQASASLAGQEAIPAVFREPCAFNVFSHDSAVNPISGLNGEEQKMIDESRKIWNDPSIAIFPTCVRVPVYRAHTQAVTFTTRERTTESEVRGALASGVGLRVLDSRETNAFPTPLKATGKDDVLVGRLRAADGGTGPTREFSLLLSGDQIRKGAALNAIQIAEELALHDPAPAVGVH